ncbi:hypothetical protein OG921_24445 [Aldersonia sp. NBC_00410]|uniref:hypothetical protein n=1 Tax=Aldersonia sp. NBC_00410 TaxID=2975954 RepID=UPI0022523903|nr:hypothetical protein [Aldersonia sp. NBC_00410]MCX5044840.1 hypothetical protein [Aldersonia sp. NBC_00410]MCX5046327.1 hypothetical protein [Aldersonia sp. NBC_00410]
MMVRKALLGAVIALALPAAAMLCATGIASAGSMPGNGEACTGEFDASYCWSIRNGAIQHLNLGGEDYTAPEVDTTPYAPLNLG